MLLGLRISLSNCSLEEPKITSGVAVGDKFVYRVEPGVGEEGNKM
jgi:hypothetical protein